MLGNTKLHIIRCFNRGHTSFYKEKFHFRIFFKRKFKEDYDFC